MPRSAGTTFSASFFKRSTFWDFALKNYSNVGAPILALGNKKLS